ncbi:uncharacterized protein V2V93DRAFT_369783 [Kockiozyma suomiensis]|uniref:uncharacterized protein n=1 Tax=Kockiozyma suomiensis TaxID=1337062 RepID=UPI003343521B
MENFDVAASMSFQDASASYNDINSTPPAASFTFYNASELSNTQFNFISVPWDNVEYGGSIDRVPTISKSETSPATPDTGTYYTWSESPSIWPKQMSSTPSRMPNACPFPNSISSSNSEIAGCSASFAAKYESNGYRIELAKQQSFVCPVQDCIKAFSSKEELIRHLHLHSREDVLYICQFGCTDNAYYSLSEYIQHCKTFHRKKKDALFSLSYKYSNNWCSGKISKEKVNFLRNYYLLCPLGHCSAVCMSKEQLTEHLSSDHTDAVVTIDWNLALAQFQSQMANLKKPGRYLCTGVEGCNMELDGLDGFARHVDEHSTDVGLDISQQMKETLLNWDHPLSEEQTDSNIFPHETSLEHTYCCNYGEDINLDSSQVTRYCLQSFAAGSDLLNHIVKAHAWTMEPGIMHLDNRSASELI